MNVHCTFTAELGGERVQKIGQRLAKLWARVSSCFFFTHGVYSGLQFADCETHQTSIYIRCLRLIGGRMPS